MIKRKSIFLCEDHGILQATTYEWEQKTCPVCKKPTTDKLLLIRTNVERIVVALAIAVLMAVSFANSATRPGKGIIVPWEPGANVWNALAFVFALITVGYGWVAFSTQGQAYNQVFDDVENEMPIGAWSWLRFIVEAQVSLWIGGFVFVGWYVYLFVIRGANG